MAKIYTHLGESERRRIEHWKRAGASVRTISCRLGRSPNTIAVEIRRNSVKGEYLARKAEPKSRNRRKASKVQSLGVLGDRATRDYVEKKLRSGWSPELVSGRWRQVHQKTEAPSTKAIYKFVHSIHGRTLEQYLPARQWKKRGGPKRKRSVALDGRHLIGERPAQVEKRQEFGHFEMDFIESGRDGRGSLLVLTERKTRYPFLVYTEPRDTAHINGLVAETLRDIPVRSITTDNDLSFQKHEELSEMIGADIFFCDAYSSWQKGTVENRNGVVRQKLPKGTDFSGVSLGKIMAVEHWLRQRPMKVLHYRTPFEVWQEELTKSAQKDHAVERGMMVERLLVNEECPT